MMVESAGDEKDANLIYTLHVICKRKRLIHTPGVFDPWPGYVCRQTWSRVTGYSVARKLFRGLRIFCRSHYTYKATVFLRKFIL